VRRCWSRIAVDNFIDAGIVVLIPTALVTAKKSDPEFRMNIFLEGKLEIK